MTAFRLLNQVCQRTFCDVNSIKSINLFTVACHRVSIDYQSNPISFMGNISKLAPYAYLAKRSGNNSLYDLLLAIPVDTAGDVDQNSFSVSTSGTRITVSYTTNSNATTPQNRYKHLEINSNNGAFVDLLIKGDNQADRSILLLLADADTQPATVSNEMQTCAPYVFVKTETVSTQKYGRPSCIILFDAGLGSLDEAIAFSANSCDLTFTLGNSGVTTDPSKFAINQNIKALLTPNMEFVFEGNVAASSSYSKPPRKSKTKLII